jgi:hypothetical protein
MTERIEQRYCIKFCQKLGDAQVETIQQIQQAFGDDARNKGAVLTMETSVTPEAKESTAGPQHCQGFVDLFFFILLGCCITNTQHKAKPSPKSTTRGYFVTFAMLCSANDQTCRQKKLCSSIRQIVIVQKCIATKEHRFHLTNLHSNSSKIFYQSENVDRIG